jgi:hypothetical protein
MAQDRAGFLWIATGDGLVRFDGYRFRPQERESPDPAARNLGWIRALLAGRDGRLWIGTESDGLAVYDPASESVTTYAAGEGRMAPQRSGIGGVMPTIRALAEDSCRRHLGGQRGRRAGSLRPAQRQLFPLPHSPPGSLPDNRVQALLIDRQGTLWVGTWAGLSRRRSAAIASSRSSRRRERAGTASPAASSRPCSRRRTGASGWARSKATWRSSIQPRPGSAARARAGRQPGRGVESRRGAGRTDVGRAARPGSRCMTCASGRLLQRLQHDLRKPAGLAGNEVTT